MSLSVELREYLGTCARAEQVLFDLDEGMLTHDRTAGGEIHTGAGIAQLWHGELRLYAQRHDAGRALQSRLYALRRPGASFFINDWRHKGPSFAAQINGVNADGRLSLRAVPSGSRVRAGDYIGFDYDGGRRALHMASEDRQPDGSGVTSVFSVEPPIEPGWTAGAAVTVGAARCRAVMIPGTLRTGKTNTTAAEGSVFSWQQTLRAI